MSLNVGISGFSTYLPPYRVSLEDWCRWTGASWDKTRAVVGNSFRMRGPTQSVYTMAGTAVMRLIERYGIDPGRIGFLGLGTESSTDNSAGAIIVKGMLDDRFRAQGLPPINRHCEVPEVKHACLGAVYALKHALRYLALEDDDRCAVVVSSDIAEYARGSSGEPTQGAGAVAMLLERDPKLLSVNLKCIGSASAYRAVDFRKPVLRNLIRTQLNRHFQDLPVFNGKYSTTCYLDETLHALSDMLRRLNVNPATYYHKLGAVFMHRPYHRMPLGSFALSYLFGLAYDSVSGRSQLGAYCRNAGLDPEAVIAEMGSTPDVLQLVRNGDINGNVYPLSMVLLKDFGTSHVFSGVDFVEDVARLRTHEGHRQCLLRGPAGVDGGRPGGSGPRRARTCRAGYSGRRLRQRRRRRGHSNDLGRELAGRRGEHGVRRSAFAVAGVDSSPVRKPARQRPRQRS